MYQIKMYALCPNCGDTVLDSGEKRFIKCKKCGRKIRSRAYGKSTHLGMENKKIWSTPNKAEDTSIIGEPVHGTPDGLPGQRPPSLLSPIRAVGGILCTIAIICFIVILFINFVAFFPAFAITAPELVNEHQHELETELILVIDDTPPKISNLQNLTNFIYPGQQVFLSAEISDLHLKESYIEMDYDNSASSANYLKSPMRYDQATNRFVTYFQAPITPGIYPSRIVAVDYPGNSAQIPFNIQVQNSPKPTLELTTHRADSIINSSTVLEFTSTSTDISSVSYNLDGGLENISLVPPYSIPTAGWVEGEHTLAIDIQSDSGENNSLNFTFFIDNTPPQLTSLSITPLSLHRNETFKNRLDDDVYYRGEFVKINVKLIEPHQKNAELILEGQRYNLVPDPSTAQEYSAIVALPDKSGDYTLQIQAEDSAGNTNSISYEIQVVGIYFDHKPIPVLEMIHVHTTPKTLPLINSSMEVWLFIEDDEDDGEITEVNYQFIDITGLNTSSGSTEDPEHITFSELSDGVITLSIKARVTYQNIDYLFITLPIPPYLFLIPYVITGWALLLFFIMIALAIILSYLYLFKSSVKDAINQIELAIMKARAPMMQSKNSLIILAQVFLAVFSFNIIYNFILAIGQVQTRTPDFSALSTWTLIYNLTSAAVYEEVISRILLIGVPLLIIHAATKKIKKPMRNYILGGDFKISKLTIVLILFSSITFGLAHAPGWDYWKVIPTVVGGLALGYLFIVKGIYLSILLHFSINFLTIPLRLANDPIGPTLLFVLIIYFWVFIGIVYISYYLVRITGLFRTEKSAYKENPE